jgi:hypothetical protein
MSGEESEAARADVDRAAKLLKMRGSEDTYRRVAVERKLKQFPADVRSAAQAKVDGLRGIAGNLAIQRDDKTDATILVNPVYVDAHHPRRAEARQRKSDKLIDHFPRAGRGYLSEWSSCADSALTSAKQPEDPDARDNWYLALAGNLGWALMAFPVFFPAGVPLLVQLGVMGVSVAGAATGSGAFAKKEEQAPTARTMVSDRLAAVADAFEHEMRAPIIEAAMECVEKNVNGEEQQDKILWNHLFAGIPYETRRKVLTTQIRSMIEKALQSYMDQYESWKGELHSEASRLAAKEVAEMTRIMGAGGEGQGAARAGMQISYTRIHLDELKKAHPFRPELTF